MKKLKKMLSLVCVLCVLMDVLVAGAIDEHIDADATIGSEKTPILVVTPGSGSGQVGYGGSEKFDYLGPESFVVEDGLVYILDSINDRISVYQSGKCVNAFSIDDTPRATLMRYDDEKLCVVDNYTSVTAVYTTAGEKIVTINHPEEMKNDYAVSVVEFGDSYLIWQTFENHYYHYDWATDTLHKDNYTPKVSMLNEGAVGVLSTTGSVAWTIESENKTFDLLGTQGNHDVVYQQYEYIPDVDILLAELSVRKRNMNGSESYAIIDFSEWYAPPMEPFYYGTDGKIYVMECLENYTVISELKLGNSDVSQMNELRAVAEMRKEAIASQTTELNSAAYTSNYTTSRSVAKGRALWMINYRWTVLANHKVRPAGSEDDVIIPLSVQNAAPGSTLVGIPYCWGGYNGYETVGSYEMFSTIATETWLTAGNILDKFDHKIDRTIGIDCSGFAASAMDFDNPLKPNTDDLLGMSQTVNVLNVKPMDFIIKSGHVMLYAGESGGKMQVYESHVFETVEGSDNYDDGKAEISAYTWADLVSRGYSIKTLFCQVCNKNGAIQISTNTHARTCSGCGYVWPEENHTYVNGVCSVCGSY